jgi:Uma2 family endonuclease
MIAQLTHPISIPLLRAPEAQDPNPTLLHGITWEQLEQLDTILEHTGSRLTYIDGIVEIMAPPSEAHETPKATVSDLLGAFLREHEIRFYRRGSETQGEKEDGARIEPDESYSIGSKKPIPDLALEVTVTSGGINKLAIYARLQIPEVWFWEDGTIEVYCLRENELYEKVLQSELIPDIDIDLVAEHSRMSDQYDAIKSFTEKIRKNKYSSSP